MENSNIIVFLDPIGRTIFAEEIPDRSTEELLVVKNPVVVHLGQAEGGKMSLQLIPIFFKEFLLDKSGDMIFSFQKKFITMSDKTKFDEKLHENYTQMHSNIVMPNATIPPKKIDLFDNEK